VISLLRGLGAVGLTSVTFLLLLAGCGGSSPSIPAGGVDSGFRPASNGFSFKNYGSELSGGTVPTNLTAHDVEKLFGARVCADAAARRCDLIPEAQAWLDSTNELMGGGHCYGFSVLAELLWQHKLNAATLGAPTTAGLEIDNNRALQRELAYDWALQILQSVSSKRIAGTPNEILDRLAKVLSPHPSETYTIVFQKRNGTGAHAVTPYAIKDKGGGRYALEIYDNNWPEKTRAISFDTKADTWTYDAAANPNEPDSRYEGDAESKTLWLFPTSPGLGTQPCPFCGKVPTAGSAGAESHNTEEISLGTVGTSDANLIVTDAAGHRLGYINGKLVKEIPGAQVDSVISNQDWKDDLAPSFVVPADARYTITVDGTALTHDDTETVAVIGPSFDVRIKDIRMRPGEKDTLVAEPDATKLSYTNSRPQSPTFELGLSENQADYSFVLSGVSDQPHSTFNLGVPPEGGTLKLQVVGADHASKLAFKMKRMTGSGVQTFDHHGGTGSLAGGDVMHIEFGDWTNMNSDLRVTTTHDGHETSHTFANQAAR
jgi:hypothetical protein